MEMIHEKSIGNGFVGFNVSAGTCGKEFSLSEIENDILLDGLKELRVHFGINCASASCADLLAVPYPGCGQGGCW